MNAAYDYWREMQKVGHMSAVIWLKDSDGKLVVFTRGEYQRQIMENIEPLKEEMPLASVPLRCEVSL